MDALDYNFAHALALFAHTSKTGQVAETRDCMLTSSGAPVALFNQGFLKTPHYKLERTLERVAAFQARTKVPVCLNLDAAQEGACAALRERGAVATQELPGMVLEPIAGGVPMPRGLVIERATDAAGLEVFARLAFESFGYPAQFAPVMFTTDWLTLPHAELFVGSLHGEPACCAMLITTGHIAGVHWVGTLGAARGRGLGAAITTHAAVAGLRRGCTLAALQASAMGAPVYRRIGFTTVRTYARYELAHRAPP